MSEFPDYDNAPLFAWFLSQLAPIGAADSSWHNDTCPSLSVETDSGRLSLHVEYKDSHKREFPIYATLYVYHDTLGDHATESPRDAIHHFAAILYQATIGYCPINDNPDITTAQIMQTLMEHKQCRD